jgi:hypothetical protein
MFYVLRNSFTLLDDLTIIVVPLHFPFDNLWPFFKGSVGGLHLKCKFGLGWDTLGTHSAFEGFDPHTLCL